MLFFYLLFPLHIICYPALGPQGCYQTDWLMIHKKYARAVVRHEPVSERVGILQIKAKPRNKTVTQAYSPTTTASQDDINNFYQSLDDIISKAHRQDLVLILGDFNAKVEVEVIATNGGMGLTGANETGERLPDFCLDHQLVLTNRCSTQHSRLYTWISPDKETRNQIDYYITVSQKWKSSIRLNGRLPIRLNSLTVLMTTFAFCCSNRDTWNINIQRSCILNLLHHV